LQKPIWQENLFNNLWLIGAVLVGFSFQLMALYVPGLQKILSTQALGIREWLVVGVISGLVIAMIEGVKFVYNKKS